jgi:hypothetical protein
MGGCGNKRVMAMKYPKIFRNHIKNKGEDVS